jgi:hypothetical protein
MKLKNVIQARNIFLAHTNDKMPAILAYKFMKAIKEFDDEENFYNEKIKEIIEAYGERDADGKFVFGKNGSVTVQKDKIDECNTKIKELEDTDVGGSAISFKPDELSGLEFTVKEIYILDEYIKE